MTEIKRSVGLDGVNDTQDVRAVREMLNRIPKGCGGPSPSLRVDPGHYDAKTGRAIRHYQRHHFGLSTGRVDPNQATIRLLSEAASGNSAICVPTPFVAAADMIRDWVVQVAQHEARRPDGVQRVAKNSKKSRSVQQANRLKEFFKVLPEAAAWDDDMYLDAKPGGKSWCGIFATWVISRISPHDKMTFIGGNANPGIYRNGKLFPTHSDNMYAKGDICLVKENQYEQWPTHHFIVAETPAPGANVMNTIEGNYADKDGNYLYHGVSTNKRAVIEYGYFSVFEPPLL